MRLLPACAGHGERHERLDVAGAITVTTSLMLAVYAIVNGHEARLDLDADAGMLGSARSRCWSRSSSSSRACANR